MTPPDILRAVSEAEIGREITSHEPKNGAHDDSSLTAKAVVDVAKQRIHHQPHLAFQPIWCEYEGGRLFLRGQVPSFYHKQLAQEAIIAMADIDQVVNDIEVVW